MFWKNWTQNQNQDVWKTWGSLELPIPIQITHNQNLLY
jgi:hypothetical protein